MTGRMQGSIATFHDLASRFKADQRIDQHEKDVYLVLSIDPAPASTSNTSPPIKLVKLIPPPCVRIKPMSAIALGETQSPGSVVVNRFEVSAISRLNFDEINFKALLYFLVVPIDSTVDEAIVVAGGYPRYKLHGEVDQREAMWRLMLEEIK